ncbi:MAG: NupC/NupG family nucleoside CNT transporter [Alphaproteobacteria bacterium]
MDLGQAQSLFGLFGWIIISWILSEQRSLKLFSIGFIGISLQLGFMALFTWVPWITLVVQILADAVSALYQATIAGTSFVFGYLGGGAVPFEVTNPHGLMVLAFQALPVVLVVSAITAVLFHLGVIQWIVLSFSFLLQKTFRIRGPVGLATAANIFMGMVEAPILAKNYLSMMQRSELFVVMTAGMATIAGTVLVIYASMLGSSIENAAMHLIIASLISAPAAVCVALIMVPRGYMQDDDARQELLMKPSTETVLDALAKGTDEGLRTYLGILGMLVVVISLVSLINMIFMSIPFFDTPVTLQFLVGVAMTPFCWLMGIPMSEIAQAGELMGIKIILNEFVAYADLSQLSPETLSSRSQLIMTYALCGFANLGSLGIMVGGLISLAPEKRQEILQLAPKSLISGTIAVMMTGSVVGVFSPS